MHDEYRPTFGVFGVENENRLGRRLYFFGVAVLRVLVLGVLVIPRVSSRIGSSPIGLKCRIFSMISLKAHLVFQKMAKIYLFLLKIRTKEVSFSDPAGLFTFVREV